MTIPERLKSQRGATRIGVTDIIVVLVLLGILLFASYRQFPIYETPPPAPAPSAAASPAPK